jgi:NAD-dependent deacetylase
MSTTFRQIADWLLGATRAVAFTGAGISTESGIPDFRSPGGVWHANRQIYFDEFLSSPEARYEYWRQKAIAQEGFLSASPNMAHRTLANWEADGRLRGVVTQNIDGLHQVGGSRSVLELHGTARHIGCLACQARYDAEEMVRRFHDEKAVPDCPQCGGLLKHATVSFGQSLPADVLETAVQWSRESDVFLAIGSSLVVTPAAELPAIAKRNGARLVIINRDPTPLDSMADFVINAEIGETFAAIAAYVKKD